MEKIEEVEQVDVAVLVREWLEKQAKICNVIVSMVQKINDIDQQIANLKIN